MSEFSPLKWRQQWQLIKNFTPEETVTLDNCLAELKTNFKVYTAGFVTLATAFNYWQRHVVPRKFYIFTLGVSTLTAAVFSCVKTSWYYVEQMDRLGQDYELSRMMKQDIFDTRPDMDTAMRA